MDVDEPTIASPASSSASDSDAYNTESARIYFGPLKTPERKFVAASKRLFPPPTQPSLRRSPRLSSPRPRSANPRDPQQAEEDWEDIEQVAQLVNEVQDEDEDPFNSGSGTPLNGDVFPDEPSSALAERISHALGNPSPPPSPPQTLSFFDPYHTTVPETSTDYQADLMSLTINDNPEQDAENPLLIFSANPPTTLILPDSSPEIPMSDAADQEELISFDPFSTPPSRGAIDNDITPVVPQVAFSVDDLLSQSPAAANSPNPRPQLDIPVINVQTFDNEIRDVGSTMAVDEPTSPNQPVAESEVVHPSDSEEQDLGNLQGESSSIVQANNAALAEELITTPLRRSTRPRRSVTPNPPPNPNPPVFITPPSSARTQVKKFTYVDPNDEIVSDSQDEGEDIRASPSRPSPTATRVRHRSPGKAPLSFKRELGSLSPTSTSVLASLAFTSPDEPNGDEPDLSTNQTQTSTSQPFSFSVFAPPPETAGPSTPIRPTGPIRFASPPKGATSPSKYRIHTPAPNDPTNTPARRIPISEAIAQGRISPQKAVQLGYKPNGTPLTSVPTPARRVLVSEASVSKASTPSTFKSNPLRYASPVKALPTKREIERVVGSVKGKEKAAEVSSKSSTVVAKLPFPLVSVATLSAEASSSSTPVPAQEDTAKAKSTPVKSSLKQITSRIPRIGAKPYARTADQKGREKAKSTTLRMVDLAKPPPKPSITAETASSARKGVRAADVGKPPGSSAPASRAKPTLSTSTSTTLLKRKREPEKSSPVKPRVIILRQVPPVEPAKATQAPAPTPSVPSKGKKPSQGPVRIRRVMDPEPPIQATPPPPSPTPEPELPTIICKPRSITPEPASKKPLQDDDDVELLPGSPMKQDPPPNASHNSSKQPSADESSAPMSPPAVIITDYSSNADSSTAGLRRTTRSRRTANMQDGTSELVPRPITSRRKPHASRADDIFSGMSMTALKDLTTSNTVKNQRYLAAKLETEVIRKQGVRPESPAVKIRTIVQRQQEEQDRQRSDRAKRRARKSDEMATSDVEGFSDVGYSSPCEEAPSEGGQGAVKHQRGAGDEEDYETPERPSGHMKRTRLFQDADLQEMDERPKRRVKWDRGLFTTVYLDEVTLGSRQTLKENRSLKGILASTAKGLRLDTLGNLPHADSPLTELVQENVTVKKIVYDSDVPASVPEIAVVKNTRSKGKKK